MIEIIPTLKQLGFSDKEVAVYMTLLKNGPSSVRTLAQSSKINRGTTYDILKSLQKNNLVSYYHKNTKQFFVAEDPSTLDKTLEARMEKLQEVKKSLGQVIPELKSLFNRVDKPVVKYYEGPQGVKTVLSDVLETSTAAKEKLYYVFSSAAIREYLYKAFPDFTKRRIAKKIHVSVIALGHKGTLAKLSQKKSLGGQKSSPTYILLYAGKVAMISVNAYKQPISLIIEDQALFSTQLQLFNFIWNNL